MLFTDNQRDPIQHGVIRRYLTFEPVQRVGVALDLVAMKEAVDDGYIDTRGTVAEPELIQNQSVLIAMMFSENLAVKSSSHVTVA